MAASQLINIRDNDSLSFAYVMGVVLQMADSVCFN